MYVLLNSVYDPTKDESMLLDKNLIDCFLEKPICQEDLLKLIDIYNTECVDEKLNNNNFSNINDNNNGRSREYDPNTEEYRNKEDRGDRITQSFTEDIGDGNREDNKIKRKETRKFKQKPKSKNKL